MPDQDLSKEFEAAGDEAVRGNVLLNRYEREGEGGGTLAEKTRASNTRGFDQ
jgi:hypothetical protein